MHQFLSFSPEVANARATGKPIVALESTIISHGMPYPQNVQTAREVEQIIRDAGAVPATIAIIGGKICIGLTEEQLEQLGNSPDAIKVSRRDLAYVLSQGKLGATTVAATMICAHLAGIKVFVTGGIGGVHRGAETSVPVVSVGQPGFPAFFTRESGFHADFQLDTAVEQASFITTKWTLGLNGGVVIAAPVPEAEAMPKEEIDAITLRALQEAEENGVTGKKVTPFLLARIKTLTEGRSLLTNIALVKNNARVGAALARALQEHPCPST